MYSRTYRGHLITFFAGPGDEYRAFLGMTYRIDGNSTQAGDKIRPSIRACWRAARSEIELGTVRTPSKRYNWVYDVIRNVATP